MPVHVLVAPEANRLALNDQLVPKVLSHLPKSSVLRESFSNLCGDRLARRHRVESVLANPKELLSKKAKLTECPFETFAGPAQRLRLLLPDLGLYALISWLLHVRQMR